MSSHRRWKFLSQGPGKLRGVETTMTVTYWSAFRSGGALYGEAKGILMSRDGQEMVTYTAEGIGRFVGPGKIRFVGSVFYRYSLDRETGIP